MNLSNFEKDDTFLSIAERTAAHQSNIQCSAQAWVIFPFCSCCNCTENYMSHKSYGHFFISTMHCTTAICFQEGDHLFFKGPLKKKHWRHPRGRKENREKGNISLKLPPLQDKANVHQQGDAALYQSFGMTLGFVAEVGYHQGKIPLLPVLTKGVATGKTITPSSPCLTKISSFILPTFCLQGNHSCLSLNGRYSSHFDLERGNFYYSPIALMDDSWMR